MASHLVAAADVHHDVMTHDHAQADVAGLPSLTDEAPTHLGNLSKANCQDSCDKATVSIPPLKPALDDARSHAVIAMTAETALPMPAFAPMRLRVPRRVGVRAPPIAIAFLRQALQRLTLADSRHGCSDPCTPPPSERHRPVVIAGDGILLPFDPVLPMARRSIEPTASILLEFTVMSTIGTRFVAALFASATLAASAQTQPAAGASVPMGAP